MQIFIDVDGVLWNTAEAIINLFNEKYDQAVDWREATEWNFSPAIPTDTPVEVVDELFASDEIYDGDMTIEGATHYINKLNKEFDNVFFCTVGKNINNAQKLKMIKRLLPELKIITISFPGTVPADKTMVNMEGAIFVDDHSTNLRTSNAKYKILFEPHSAMKWNENWGGRRFKSWQEIYEFVHEIKDISQEEQIKYISLLQGKNHD